MWELFGVLHGSREGRVRAVEAIQARWPGSNLWHHHYGKFTDITLHTDMPPEEAGERFWAAVSGCVDAGTLVELSICPTVADPVYGWERRSEPG